MTRIIDLLFLLLVPALTGCTSNELFPNPLITIESSIYQTGEALHLYYSEVGHFPEPVLNPPYLLEKLTTPIAYRFSSVPLDYFQEKQNLNAEAYKHRRAFYLKILLLVVILMVVQLGWMVFIVLKRKNRSMMVTFLVFEFLLIFLCLLVNHKIDLLNINRLTSFLNDNRYPSVQFYKMRMIAPSDKNRSFYYSLSKDGDAFVWSPGPDFMEEFTLNEIPNLETEYLLNTIITYSPSNGLISAGDLWTCVLSNPLGYPLIEGLPTFHEPLN
jgi:hypothetical protein